MNYAADGTKQQLQVDTPEEKLKTNRFGSMQPRRNKKSVAFQAECLVELIIQYYTVALWL